MKGFTLLETIIAVGVLAIGIVGSLTLVSKSVQTVKMSQNRLVASYLAQEGIELVRNIRDSNWAAGDPWDDWSGDGNSDAGSKNFCEIAYNDADLDLSTCDLFSGPFLKLDTASNFYNYTSGVDTIFKRTIFIGEPSVDQKQVAAMVSWDDRGNPRFVTLVGHLYKWK